MESTILGSWVRFAITVTGRVADDLEQPECSSHPEPEPWPSVSRRTALHPWIHVHKDARDR